MVARGRAFVPRSRTEQRAERPGRQIDRDVGAVRLGRRSPGAPKSSSAGSGPKGEVRQRGQPADQAAEHSRGQQVGAPVVIGSWSKATHEGMLARQIRVVVGRLDVVAGAGRSQAGPDRRSAHRGRPPRTPWSSPSRSRSRRIGRVAGAHWWNCSMSVASCRRRPGHCRRRAVAAALSTAVSGSTGTPRDGRQRHVVAVPGHDRRRVTRRPPLRLVPQRGGGADAVGHVDRRIANSGGEGRRHCPPW